jgi:hypothetical protein
MKEKQVSVKELSDDEYVLINNALASLNLLAIYYQHGYVRRKDVLELWGYQLSGLFWLETPFWHTAMRSRGECQSGNNSATSARIPRNMHDR